MRELLTALVASITVTASGADEIAFRAKEVYYTDSQGSDPGPVENGKHDGIWIDISPDGAYYLQVAYTLKSFGEWYEIIAHSRWGEPLVEWFDNPSWPSVFIEAAIEAIGEDTRAPRLYSPRWSPDGSLILFARLNELIVLDPYSRYGEVVQEIPILSESDIIHYCDWAPNERYVVSNHRREIWISDNNSDQFLGEGFNPDVSPDGTKIVFIVPGESQEKSIWTMDLDGDNKEHVHTYIQRVRTSGSLVAWSPDSKEIAFFTSEWNTSCFFEWNRKDHT